MPHEILQHFLKQNLLDLGEDESRWEYITATVDEVKSVLRQNRAKVASYLLTAIDEDCPVDEPVFVEVEDLLMQRWRLLRQRFAVERPRQILRSIIFQALFDLINEERDIGCIVWLSGSSYAEHAVISRSIAKIVEQLLSNAQGAFTMHPHPLSLPSLSGEALVADSDTLESEIDQDQDDESKANQDLEATELAELSPKDFRSRKSLELLWASFLGGSYKGEDIPERFKPVENDIWEDVGYWADDFPPKVASFFVAFAKYIEKAIKNEMEAEFQSTLHKLSIEAQSVSDRNKLEGMQQPILWWKHSLYSPKMHISYRKLSPVVATACMVHDLADMVPRAYPMSVDFVLAETVADLLRNGNQTGFETRSIGEVLLELTSSEVSEFLRPLIETRSNTTGRGTLIDFVEALIHGVVHVSDDLYPRVGCLLETEISLPDFAVWLFRNVQARKFEKTIF